MEGGDDNESAVCPTSRALLKIWYSQELDDFLHVGVLLRLGDVVRLSEVGRDPERLSNRLRPLVHVGLQTQRSASSAQSIPKGAV